MISFSSSVASTAAEPLMNVSVSELRLQQQSTSLMETTNIEHSQNLDIKQSPQFQPGRFTPYKSPFRKPFRPQQQQLQPKPKVDKSVLCETCNIVLNSQIIYETHCKGVKHLKRLAQINAILPHVSTTGGQNEQSDTNGVNPIVTTETAAQEVNMSECSQQEGRSADGSCDGSGEAQAKQVRRPFKRFKKNLSVEPKVPRPTYSCEICNVSGMHELAYQAHLAGKNHAKKIKAAGGDPSAATAAATATVTSGEVPTSTAANTDKSNAPKPAIIQYRCEICNVNLTSDVQLELHVKSAKHQKKLTLSNAASGDTGNGEVKQEYKCDVCNIKMVSQQQVDAHMAGKKHQKKLASNPSASGDDKKATEDDEKYAHLNIAWDKYRILDTQSIPDPNMRGKYEFYCALCNKYMQKKPQLVDHLKSKRHHQKIYEKRQRDAGLPVGNANAGKAKSTTGKAFRAKFNANKKINFVPSASGGSFSSMSFNQTANSTVSTNAQTMGLLGYPVNPFYVNNAQQPQQPVQQDTIGFKRKPPNSNQMDMNANAQKLPRLDSQQGYATAPPPMVSSNYGYGYDFSGYAGVNFFSNQYNNPN